MNDDGGLRCGGGGRGGSISTPQSDNEEYQSVGTRSGDNSRRKYMQPLQRAVQLRPRSSVIIQIR